MKTLGIDLGTNSIGLALREENNFEWFGVYTFKKGVGEGKTGEFSFAADRTKHRSTRRLYNARRYRKWEALKVLIEYDYCPLTLEELNRWKHYEKNVGRIFPLTNEQFNKWIKLDFNNDDSPDYTSPYQLRRELITTKLGDSVENKYKIGRALYHIAQRRGFKSSRKTGDSEETSVHKGSTETKTIGRNEYEKLIIEKGSLGAAFAHLEDRGIRVRNRYTLRKDYLEEVEKIIDFQGLEVTFAEKIKKAIFYQRPLRSQKGLVGKCTLEKNKYRCPVSHPKFEAYRAWAFINNIKYKENEKDSFKPLPLELKQKLYKDVFFRKSKSNFKFKDIRKYLVKNERAGWILNYKLKYDEINVAGCPVSARLKAVFGDDWEATHIKTNRTDKKGQNKIVEYDINDIWHVLFSFDDEEVFEEFLKVNINLNETQIHDMMVLFKKFPVGYAKLSLKAINNILPFLKEGMIYTEAVMLAKIPELIGKDLFRENQEIITNAVKDLIKDNKKEKDIIFITNNLISRYKALEIGDKFGYKDVSYRIGDMDKREIIKAIEKYYGKGRWQKEDEPLKTDVIEQVTNKYQGFFSNSEREYFKPPHLLDQLKDFLIGNFNIDGKEASKLYHPSQIDIYTKKEGAIYLDSPKTAAFKNPMAYKSLYHLRDVINYLIKIGKIDNETKIVIELARDKLNDKNKRAAIEIYQRRREIENKEFAKAISELNKDSDFKGNANPDNKTDIDKFRLWTEQIENIDEAIKEISATKDDIKKYRLWKEQHARCFYTGKTIRLTDLFNTNIIDFEHTIPRSKSFDNSLANLTVCYADYNRNIKRNRIPTELENYDNDWNGYSAIKPRLQNWIDKIDNLTKQIEFWRFKSKTAIDRDSKDYAIKQQHLRYFEYDYWRNKVDRFTRKDIPQGFINSQLTDTQLITRYAYHFLKTIFNKVDVQKGTITADFRKIYGIQNKDEIKSRAKHHHHAIDAAVLTLIPDSAKREEILKRAYEYEENGQGQYHEKPFPGFNFRTLKDIEKNILINNLADRDKILSKARRIVRKRGRIVWLRDKNGNILYDDNENKVPKIAQGDSIRGQLHEETFYGKIRLPNKDEAGNILRDEKGKIILSKEYWVVKRELVDNLKISNGIIKDEVIDKHLKRYIEKQLGEGVPIKYIKDFNGNIIRHIRIRVKAGRGFLSDSSLFSLKEQTYKSIYKHKQQYYVKTGDNYAFALYIDNDDYDKANKKVISRNLFEVSRIKSSAEINNVYEFFEKTIKFGRSNAMAHLYHVFQTGQKVLFYENNREELKELGNELSNRLFYVKTLFNAEDGRIQFQHHLEARNDEQLSIAFPKETFGQRGKNGFSKFSTDFIQPRLLLSPGNLSCIIEDKDFTMSLDGQINFLY